jgi:hypothetical protein
LLNSKRLASKMDNAGVNTDGETLQFEETVVTTSSELLKMDTNIVSTKNGLVLSGFQLKGTTKRAKISSKDFENDIKIRERDAILNIEKGVIKSAEVLEAEQMQLIIPLPPSRSDIHRAVKSTATFIDEKIKEIDSAPKSLEQLAADELLAELNGVKREFNEFDTLSIPTSDNNIIKKNAPLLMASLAPELVGLKTDEERFKADIDMRPEDMNVRSDAYRSVPIEEFGAAMLRYNCYI